jgi:hypothetical protein
MEAIWEGQQWLFDGFHRLTVAIARTVTGTFSTTQGEDAIRAADTPRHDLPWRRERLLIAAIAAPTNSPPRKRSYPIHRRPMKSGCTQEKQPLPYHWHIVDVLELRDAKSGGFEGYLKALIVEKHPGWLERRGKEECIFDNSPYRGIYMDELAGNEKDPTVVKVEGGGALTLLLEKISTSGRSLKDSKPKKTGPTTGPRKYAVIVLTKHLVKHFLNPSLVVWFFFLAPCQKSKSAQQVQLPFRNLGCEVAVNLRELQGCGHGYG